jgi:hypothetical protein
MADSEKHRYYASVRDDGSVDGILRVSDAQGGGWHLENGVTGEWVTDQILLRHFVNPGTAELTLIDRATAKKQAAKYGVELPD